MRDGEPRILIIRLSAIGDVVRTLPALHVLRDAYPAARIDWAVEPKSAALVEGHPALDEILVFDRAQGLRRSAGAFTRFVAEVRRRRYDTVIDFHGILKSGAIAGLSGARRRIGFSRPRSQECSSLFYTRRVKLPSMGLNRVEENLILCENLVTRPRRPDMTIYVSPEVQEHVDAYFDSAFESGKHVVAVHAPVDRPEKQWPLLRFAELVDLLLADGRFEVVLTWGPGQLPVAEDLRGRCRRKPLVGPEFPDLKYYAWFIHRAALYVGGDTGPMHIASAMNTPVVAIFGGTDPTKHAPFRQPYRVLHVGPDAENSTLLSAAEQLNRISAETVYDACVSLIMRTAELPPQRPV